MGGRTRGRWRGVRFGYLVDFVCLPIEIEIGEIGNSGQHWDSFLS
jgi:hypothetical protein